MTGADFMGLLLWSHPKTRIIIMIQQWRIYKVNNKWKINANLGIGTAFQTIIS